MKADDFLNDTPSADDFLSATFAPVKRSVNRALTDYPRDAAAAALKIGPTALKGVGDLLQLFTAGSVGGGLSGSMKSGMQSIDEVVGSDALRSEKANINAVLQGSDKGIGDVLEALVQNPGAVVDMGVSTVGSMALPMGVVGLAGKLAKAGLTTGKATGLAVGTGAAQNAAETFTDVNGGLGDKYTGAALSGLASAVLGKVLGGGLEGQIARKMAQKSAGVSGFRGVAGAVAKEAGQEGGEEFSNALAKNVGENAPLDLNSASKQATLGAVLGALVSGPVSVKHAMHDPISEIAKEIDRAAGEYQAPTIFAPPLDQPFVQSVQPSPARPAAPAAPAPEIPQLGFDPTVKPAVMLADSQGNVRPMSADDFLQADNARQSAIDTGLTADVRRAQENRSQVEPPQPLPSDLLERLRAEGWKPPQQVFDEKQNLSPENQTELDNQNFDDFEKAYQGDVKDSIKARLGVDQQDAPQPVEKSYAKSPFLREIAARGGIHQDERSDTGIDRNQQTRGGKAMPLPYNIGGQPLYRANGLRADQLVESLVSQGYLTQTQADEADAGGVGGSAELAYDLIRRELTSPGSVQPINLQGDAAQAVSTARVSAELESAANAIGFDTRGLNDDQVNAALNRIGRRRTLAAGRKTQYDAKQDAQRERAKMLDVKTTPTFDDDGIDWDAPSNASTEDAMRFLGFTEQEIQDATANRPESQSQSGEAVRQAAQDDARGSQRLPARDAGNPSGQRQAENTPDSEGLTSYTPEELRERDERIAEQAKAEARQQAQAEAKNKSDRDRADINARQDASADNFQFGQSADDSLSGQQGMFSRKKKTPAQETLVELRKRESVLKSLRKCLG